MKILILTKLKPQLLKNKKVKNTEEYILNDHAFEGWAAGFKKHGHDVILDGRYSFFIPLNFCYRFPGLNPYIKKLFSITGFHRLDNFLLSLSIEKLVKEKKIELIFTEINDFLTISSIERMKSRGVFVTEWFGVFPDMVKKRVLQTLNHYSYIWCPGDIIEEFQKNGVTISKIQYISTSYNEKFWFHEFDENFAYDVCFVGGVGKFHSNRIKLLEKVVKHFDRSIFYGQGLDSVKFNSALKGKNKGWADPEIMRKLFSSSKIALNLTLDGYERVKRGVNARSFEIPACNGALQLAKYNPNFEEFFSEREIVYFRNSDELISKIELYLRNETQRREIVKKAYEKNKNYRYQNKIQKLINIIKDTN